MAIVHNTISIYSNDGTAVLGSVAVAESSITVQETGFSDALGSYEYGGDKKFLGFATSANATEPTYAIGDTFTVSSDITLYIVESNADSITDLTNTTWYIHDDCSPYTGGTIYVPFEVGYLSGGGSYYYVDVYAVGTHINDRNYVINFSSYSGSSPDNENGLVSEYGKLNLYYTDAIFGGSPIVFKFGNDLGSANLTPLITWLESNGTQLKVTDLTNTTWYVPAGWEATAGYGIFDIEYIADDIQDNLWSEFGIGYSYNEDIDRIATANNISVTFGIGYGTGNSFSLAIQDGTDTTNPKLIAWLSKWGELRGAEEPEQPTTPTKKFTRLYIGEIVKTIGNKMFRKLQTTEYVPLPTLASPTVELSETTLNIYDEEGLATSYDILVDGEVKATVEKTSGYTVSVTSTNKDVYVYEEAPTGDNYETIALGTVSRGSTVDFTISTGKLYIVDRAGSNLISHSETGGVEYVSFENGTSGFLVAEFNVTDNGTTSVTYGTFD